MNPEGSSFTKKSEKRNFKNIAQAGLAAAAVLGGAHEAGAQGREYISFEDQVRVQHLQHSTQAKIEKALASKLSGDTWETLLQGVSQKDLIDALPSALLTRGPHIRDFAAHFILQFKYADTDSRASSALFLASEALDRALLTSIADKAVAAKAPWLGEFYKQYAGVMDRGSFERYFYRNKSFAELPREQQKILAPIVEEKYGIPSATDTVKTWLALPNDRSQKLDHSARFITERFGNLTSTAQRIEVVREFVNIPDMSDPIIGKLIQKYDWWKDDPDSDALLERMFQEAANQKVQFVLHTPYREILKGKPWAERIERLTVFRDPQLIYKHYELFKSHPWAAEHLKNMAKSYPRIAIEHFDRYANAPTALDTLRLAIQAAPGPIHLHVLSHIMPRLSEQDRETIATFISPRIETAAAVLAFDIDPNYQSFLKDPALDGIEHIDRSLLMRLVPHKKMSPNEWALMKNSFNDREPEFIKNAKLRFLQEHSKAHGGVNPVELEEAVTLVKRNLFAQGIERPTAGDIAAEVERIIQKRSEIANINVFTDADVIVASHEELWDGGVSKGKPRFGTAALISGLRKQQMSHSTGVRDLSFTELRPLHFAGNRVDRESALKVKADVLKGIRTSLQPLVVFLDGHGSSEYFFLSKGQVLPNGEVLAGQDAVSISAQEIADALIERSLSQKAAGMNVEKSNISFVFSACMQYQLVGSIADMVSKRGVALPKEMITGSEFAQYSYNDPGNLNGSKLGEYIASKGDLKSFFVNRPYKLDAKPALFVPMKTPRGEKLMQVSGIGSGHSVS